MLNSSKSYIELYAYRKIQNLTREILLPVCRECPRLDERQELFRDLLAVNTREEVEKEK